MILSLATVIIVYTLILKKIIYKCNFIIGLSSLTIYIQTLCYFLLQILNIFTENVIDIPVDGSYFNKAFDVSLVLSLLMLPCVNIIFFKSNNYCFNTADLLGFRLDKKIILNSVLGFLILAAVIKNTSMDIYAWWIISSTTFFLLYFGFTNGVRPKILITLGLVIFFSYSDRGRTFWFLPIIFYALGLLLRHSKSRTKMLYVTIVIVSLFLVAGMEEALRSDTIDSFGLFRPIQLMFLRLSSFTSILAPMNDIVEINGFEYLLGTINFYFFQAGDAETMSQIAHGGRVAYGISPVLGFTSGLGYTVPVPFVAEFSVIGGLGALFLGSLAYGFFAKGIFKVLSLIRNRTIKEITFLLIASAAFFKFYEISIIYVVKNILQFVTIGLFYYFIKIIINILKQCQKL